MFVKRIQVEGGFLAGLDLRLSPGLNALIGARGTGKTSVIELIRFGLDAASHTSKTAQRSLEHARSILGGGEVAITLSDGIDDLVVTRAADDEAPRSPHPYLAPMVFSQTEIETVGLSETGRLNLLDGFVSGRGRLRATEANVISSIRSIYQEIASVEAELSSLSETTSTLPSLKAERDDLISQQASFETGSDLTREQQARLSELSARLSAIGVEESALSRFAALTTEWEHRLSAHLDFDFGPEEWAEISGDDPLAPMRGRYMAALRQVAVARDAFGALSQETVERIESITPVRSQVETQSRTLRTELERVAEGAGDVARRLTQVSGQIAQAEAVERLAAERSIRLATLRERRDAKLDQLSELRDARYAARLNVARVINDALGPRINVSIDRYAQYEPYTRSIADALRGSGMKYNDLAATISQHVSPRELLDIVDRQDFSGLSSASGIPADRAARLIGHLRDQGVIEIATCLVEDDVLLSLLDGTSYKDASILSAGQRCTIVLPIVLIHTERPVIIDQPEDHIDNAFITETLIRALRSRKLGEQVLVSTHNANIPVLGEAAMVIELVSDGRNGFVEVCKPVADPSSVSAITSLMEGGAEAFETRAKFYRDHGA